MPDPLSEICESDVAVIRDVLIEATDIVRPGDEPYVGWSAVLAERIAVALEARRVESTNPAKS